jgi:predicted DNA-binding ribbon-helix-helix protein
MTKEEHDKLRTTISIKRDTYNMLNSIATKNNITVQKLLEILSLKLRENQIQIKL